MKRSEINAAIKKAATAFKKHGWALPPEPRWDVTDLGLGNFKKYGLVLVNLTEQPEYCEKLMFSLKNQVTPCHFHAKKKEDIICRYGAFAIKIASREKVVRLQVNNVWRNVLTTRPLVLKSGERITLPQHVSHSFWAVTPYAILGEVSTANDDAGDNFFEDKNIGRFSNIEEDEKPLVNLLSDGE